MSEENLAKIIMEQITDALEGAVSTLRAGDDRMDSAIAGALESVVSGFDEEYMLQKIAEARAI